MAAVNGSSSIRRPELSPNSHGHDSIDAEAVEFFKKYGFLIIRNLLSKAETEDLQRWAQEVHDWQPTPDSTFMPYEVYARISDQYGRKC